MRSETSGSLGDITLTDILQVLSVNRKTCTLYLRKGNERGEISLQDGQVVDARTGDRVGEEAFFALLDWDGADFFIGSATPSDVPKTIQKDFHSLILEWMEHREAEARIPPEVPPSLPVSPMSSPQRPSQSLESSVQALLEDLVRLGWIRPLRT